MRRLFVQEDGEGWWEVRDPDDGAASLYRGDRIWAEGYARRVCQPTGGTIRVVPADGAEQEYVVRPPARPPRT